jgi:hypothetical protein
MIRTGSTRGRFAALVLIAAMTMGTLSGCTLVGRALAPIGRVLNLNKTNDYAEANKRLDRESKVYSNARHEIVDDAEVRRAGVVTDAQFREFQTLEQNEIDANVHVAKDVADWKSSGTKPPSFEGHARTLLEWQQKLIAFVRRVKP